MKREPINDHDIYNVRNYPILIAKDRGNWDIYANESGFLASIAVVPGCVSTGFGDRWHLASILLNYPCRDWSLTMAGCRLLGKRIIRAWHEKRRATRCNPSA